MAHPMDEVVKALRAASPKDGEAVRRAYDFAEKAHGTELRKSGEPYIVHPAAIALTLAKLGMDRDTVIAGILHDTIEDTPVTPDDIEREFGKTVRFLVEGVTKLSKLKYRGLERHVESLRRLLVATANDIRVIIIKLTDRLHNMETIEFVEPVEKRNRIAMETMEVYVPIAARLGIGVLKAQLEDLAFKTLEPERFQKIATYLKNESEKAKDAIDEAVDTLKKELGAARIPIIDIHARVKGVHSFAMKLDKKGNDIDKVYDTFAIRIILATEEECYRALGIIHGLWRPLPGRVKDYIATAKANGYRSVHTTVVTPKKVTIEVQLRTEDMNREAQFGIASHFSYKQGPERGAREAPMTIVWLSRFIPSLMRTKRADNAASQGLSASTTRWLKELTEAAENFQEQEAFRQALKEDFFAERMFVFTPKGDVIDLPVGATPIDFAYAIHSDLGDTMMGAKVNGKIMQLTGTLKNGDMVEVITRKSAKPNRKWLEVVKTSSAKQHIRDALNKASPGTV